MSYFGRGGFEYESIQSLSKGETWLREDYGVDLGEPVSLIGGITGTWPNAVFRKFLIKSYDAAAGAEECLGVSLDKRYASSGVSLSNAMMTAEELFVLRPQLFNREISILLEGVCMVKNVDTSLTIEKNDTVIPANGGCEKMTATGQYSLGKSTQRILPGMRGMIIIKPDYEKPTL